MEEPHKSRNVMLTNNNSSYVLRCPNTSLTYHSSYYINFNLQLPLILTCMVGECMMFWQKSKTMQYACANVHFTIQYAYLREGRECFFCLFQNQKSFQSTVMNTKSKTRKHFYKPNYPFWKQMGRVRISFHKRTTPSTPICQCTITFQIS